MEIYMEKEKKEKKGFFSKLVEGLTKTRNSMSDSRLSDFVIDLEEVVDRFAQKHKKATVRCQLR